MAAIDLIVLGMLKKEPMGAYDIQKLVEYRNISKWVKISTPSIYKKAIQLEEKGFIKGSTVKEGKMPEKVIYSLPIPCKNFPHGKQGELYRQIPPMQFSASLLPEYPNGSSARPVKGNLPWKA